jgi:cell division septation protein DedD
MPSKPKPQSSPSAEASAPRRRTKPTTTRAARPRKAAETEAASPVPKPARRRAAKKLAAAAVAVETVAAIAPPEPEVRTVETSAIAAESIELPAEAPPLLPPPARTPSELGGSDAPSAGWLAARQPAAWTAVFLGIILALAVGYWAGRSESGGSDPTVVVAHAAARPEAAPMPAAFEGAIDQAPEPAAAEPEPTPAVEEAAAAAPAEPTGLHLQVSALKSRRAAAALQRRLERDGLPARTLDPVSDDLIRVVVGPAEDRETLGAWAAQLRGQGLQPFPKRF